MPAKPPEPAFTPPGLLMVAEPVGPLALADPLGLAVLADSLGLAGAVELEAGVLTTTVAGADELVGAVLDTEVLATGLLGGGLLLWFAVVLDPLQPRRISNSTMRMIRTINAHSHQGNLRRRRSSSSGSLGTTGSFGPELPPLLYDTPAPH